MYYGNYYSPYAYAQQAAGMQQPSVYQGMYPQSTQYDSMFVYPNNLNDALRLILEALSGESEDRQFYTWLIEQAPSEDKQIIMGIRDNEIRHYQLFQQLYLDLTGSMAPRMPGEEFTAPANYCEGLRRALLGEQNAVQKYRKILYAMQNPIHINIMTEIITDEIRHGILYNYLYAKNGCEA
jgi:rubrerythrin